MKFKHIVRAVLKKIFSSNFFYISLLILISLFYLRNLFTPNFPQAADAEYHLARIVSYKNALLNSQFPVRWASNLNYGLGYPVFVYNYPLPFILGALLLLLGFSADSSLTMIIVVSVLSATIGMYAWISTKLHKFFSFFAAFIFVTTPYLMNLVYGRASIGEIVALGLFPWVGLVSSSYVKKQTRFKFVLLILIFSLFGLAHNITTIFGSITLFFYLLIEFRKKIFWLLPPTIAATLLIMWFWIPAIWEMRFTTIASSSLNLDYFRHFLNFWGIWNIPPDLSYGVTFTQQPVKLQIGWAQLLILIISIILFLKKRLSKLLVYWLGVSFLSIFLLFPISRTLWQILPLVHYFQFPLRLLWYLSIATAWLSGYIFSKEKLYFVSLGIVFVALLNTIVFYKPQHFLLFDDSYLEDYPLSTAAANEYNPIWYDEMFAQDFADTFKKSQVITTNQAEIKMAEVNSLKLVYQITTEKPTKVIEKGIYYPGWETTIDGRRIDLSQTAADFYGLRNFEIEAGSHTVVSQWTENLWDRKIGNSLFFIGLIYTTCLIVTFNYSNGKFKKLGIS